MQYVDRARHHESRLDQHHQGRKGYRRDADRDHDESQVMDAGVAPQSPIQPEQPEAQGVEHHDPADGDPHDGYELRLDVEIEAEPEGSKPRHSRNHDVVQESERGTRIDDRQANHAPSRRIVSSACRWPTSPPRSPAQARKQARTVLPTAAADWRALPRRTGASIRIPTPQYADDSSRTGSIAGSSGGGAPPRLVRRATPGARGSRWHRR